MFLAFILSVHQSKCKLLKYYFENIYFVISWQSFWVWVLLASKQKRHNLPDFYWYSIFQYCSKISFALKLRWASRRQQWARDTPYNTTNYSWKYVDCKQARRNTHFQNGKEQLGKSAKHLLLYFTEEGNSYRFRKTWGWVK